MNTTRNDHTLDLLCMTNTSLVNRIETVPPLGDHDMIFSEINIFQTLTTQNIHIRESRMEKVIPEDNSDSDHYADDTFDVSNRSFHKPVPVNEESLTDSSVDDPMKGIDATATITLPDIRPRQQNDKTWWWCSVRGKSNRCQAAVSQIGDNFVPGKLPNNHPSAPSSVVLATISASVKAKAALPVLAFTRSSEIVKTVLATLYE
ncbi:unnamed protein product [Mytilus coruscus]|uniref:FLYWCH-type domain-containing protein n=1 Tax=Mytilus coruscus TaxID=42192 RepID=A0A6J8BEJ4_MYTCO|nr:unnamed protein product [Mytilus coruscus]